MSVPEPDIDDPPTTAPSKNTKAEYPWWMPPHYRALAKSSEKHAAKYIDKSEVNSEKVIKACHSSQDSSNSSKLLTHGNFLSAMAILICADLIIWYGVKKWFYRKPPSFWSTMKKDHQHRQRARQEQAETTRKRGQYKKYQTVQSPHTFRSHITSQSTSIPPVVAHHMRILKLHHITDRLPTRTEVKKAYRQLSLETHPDTLPVGASEAERKAREKKFIVATTSYEMLLTLTSPLSG